jgi:tRNA pseudouridine55 synthase
MSSSDFTRSHRRVERRDVHGVLLLDKPSGITSNTALQICKRVLRADKAGHTGTLDPMASGLLPLCFGEATKFAQDLLAADKAYEATLKLGVRTSTGDAEGEVVENRSICHTRAQLDSVLKRFTGQIVQIPPMHSALKKDGKALYEYARAGIEVERASRSVIVHALKLLEGAGDTVRIHTHVSKGTYIRTLAEDIGAALGCGAHLVALRRTQVARFSLDQSVTLAQFEAAQTPDQYLQPVDTLAQDLERIQLEDGLAQRLKQGQRLAWPDRKSAATALVRLYDNQEFIGLGLIEAGRLSPHRILNFSKAAS